MDIKDIFEQTNTNLSSMLSELIETQCAIKGMLHAIIAEISKSDPEKENEILSIANKVKDQELLRVVARFTSEDAD
jgi:hypothetical protein